MGLGVFAQAVGAAEIAVIYSLVTERASANYPTYAQDFQAFSTWLESNFEFDVLTEEEVIAGALKPYRLAILPNNGVMSDAEVRALREFVQSGGKLLAFYSTSLRDPGLALVGYQIGDIFGITWSRFTTDPNFQAIKIDTRHPALAKAPELVRTATSAVQEIQVTTGRVLGVRATADGVASENAVIAGNDNAIFIANHMASPSNLAFEDVQQLLKSIITYFAPNSVRK